MFGHYENIKRNANSKMLKFAWFGEVQGHTRSLVALPLDRAHMTSYLTLIETMHTHIHMTAAYTKLAEHSVLRRYYKNTMQIY